MAVSGVVPEVGASLWHPPLEGPVLHRLGTARGQIEAVVPMIEAGRPCADAVHQIAAARGILAKVIGDLTERHIRYCVAPMISEGDPAVVNELLAAMFAFSTATSGAGKSSEGTDQCRKKDKQHEDSY